MKHVFWLFDGLLGGRPGPVQASWDLDEIYAAGLRAIVSLNTEPEPAAVVSAGLRHYSLPMPAILPMVYPIQNLLLRDLGPVLETLHTEISAGQPTLIHCHAGKDRTGLAMTAYLVRYHGMNTEEAINQVRAVRPIAMSARGYESTARRFAQWDQEYGHG